MPKTRQIKFLKSQFHDFFFKLSIKYPKKLYQVPQSITSLMAAFAPKCSTSVDGDLP